MMKQQNNLSMNSGDKTMKIETASVADAKELLDIYRPYVEKTAITFEYDVPSLEEFSERIKTISAKYPYLKAVKNGEIIGSMGILNMNACIAVPKTEDEHLTADCIFFHEKMGFKKVGIFHDSGYKFSTWYDMTWMEKMLGEHKEIQPEVEFGDWAKYLD